MIVPVKRVRAERRHIKIEVAVVIEISHGHACLVDSRASSAARHTGPLGDIRERSVVIVVVQRVRGARRAVDEKEVLESVVVVVDPGDARPERLDHALFRRGA